MKRVSMRLSVPRQTYEPRISITTSWLRSSSSTGPLLRLFGELCASYCKHTALPSHIARRLSAAARHSKPGVGPSGFGLLTGMPFSVEMEHDRLSADLGR